MVFSIISLACLTGAPLAGALIQSNGGNYLHAQIFGGTTMICRSLMLVGARIVQIREEHAICRTGSAGLSSS